MHYKYLLFRFRIDKQIDDTRENIYPSKLIEKDPKYIPITMEVPIFYYRIGNMKLVSDDYENAIEKTVRRLFLNNIYDTDIHCDTSYILYRGYDMIERSKEFYKKCVNREIEDTFTDKMEIEFAEYIFSIDVKVVEVIDE